MSERAKTITVTPKREVLARIAAILECRGAGSMTSVALEAMTRGLDVMEKIEAPKPTARKGTGRG